MNRGNRKSSNPDDDLPKLRKRLNRIIDEEIDKALREGRITTLDEICKAVRLRSSILLKQMSDQMAEAEFRSMVGRRLKHSVRDPDSEAEPEYTQAEFEGMEEWTIRERLTWEEKGKVVYGDWFESLQEDRTRAREYKQICMDADAQNYRDLCEKDDRAQKLVKRFGDLPLRELIRLDREERRTGTK